MSDRKSLWATEEDGLVEVDQGALIRKVLARYPGEFTLFRELLQNSDDAQSDSVEIRFETATSTGLPNSANLKLSDIVQWTFKNNGNQFTPEDWTRLVKIAMGNPNPARVGAFGVGFYSLFSVTENPVVLSGGREMAFFWDKGQLRFRKSTIPSEGTAALWTTFSIPLREPGPMPGAVDFMRFLATSITFMVHIKDVKVFLDGRCIGHVNKSPRVTEAVDPPIESKHSSRLKLMVVDRVQCHRFTIEAKLSTEILGQSSTEVQASSEKCDMPSANQILLQPNSCVQSSTGDPPHFYAAKLDLTVFTAVVHVKVDERLSKELLRCTYKTLPSPFDYSLVYTGKEEYDRSFVDQKNQPLQCVFQGLRADLNGGLDPRIFIGHSTSQTTGIGGHMASPFIPTVERESIDLVDKNVAVWNEELLYVGGFLARTVYELELSAIQASWKEAAGAGSNKHGFQDLRNRFIHLLRFFTFHPSTPSPKVAQLLQQSFYNCSTSPLRLLSSVGVRHASDIRSFDSLCSKFLKHVPMLSHEITNVAQPIVNALPREHKIRPITLSDVLQDLRDHTLDQVELVAYLQWQLSHERAVDGAKLLEVATFRSGDGTRIELSTIRSFINSSGLGANIPSDGPTPLSLMPFEITKNFNPTQLTSLGWQEFTIADWLRHISKQDIRSANPKHDFVLSAHWAERVLYTISIAWSSSDEIRGLAKLVFANKKYIPIMHKLYNPEETYLPSSNTSAFDDLDLSVVRFPSGLVINSEMERLLVDLGVKQHLAPQLLLKRMKETGKWETLIDYLVEVRNTLRREEIDELKTYDAFAGVGGRNDTNKMRFRADELYPPIPIFKKLNLRVIEWERRPGWQDTAPEAELMYLLGLRRHPPLEEIIKLCSQDDAVGQSAFNYLRDNLRSVYPGYNPDDFQHIAFIPAANMSGPRLEKLAEVFLDRQWKALGLSVIRDGYPEDILEKLGVQRHPPSSLLLHTLKTTPPPNQEIARQWFEILSNHVSCFKQSELDDLARSPIVPKIIPASGEERKRLCPVECYLKRGTKDDLYSKLFHFVNFSPGAIQFLRACGAKNEPSEEDVAERLADNPQEFFEFAGHERLLQELRDLASRHTQIPNKTISKMRLKPVLLGVQRKKTANQDGWEYSHSLFEPNKIVIVNDIHAFQLFSDSIVAAPENMSPELEKFYQLLGCKHLTKVVRSEYNPSGKKEEGTEMCSELTASIKQRFPLFLRYYHHQPRTSAPHFSGAVTVRACEQLFVSKTLTIGEKETIEKRSVWATAEDEQGTIQVWISRAAKKDMYELAVSLCRLLFDAVNLNDALLLTSILSEDLEVLKGRGYEVGNVPQSPQYPDDPRSTKKTSACSTETPPTDPTTLKKPDVRSLPQSKPATRHPREGSVVTSCPPTSSRKMPGAFVTETDDSGVASDAPDTTPTAHPSSPWSPSYIESIVKKSIQACNSKPFSHHSDAATIKFLNDGYCSNTEQIDNLTSLGSMKNVGVCVGQGISNVDTFMQDMKGQLERFVGIIIKVSEIYGLPTESLRIFYDTTQAAGCIAFNRQGVLHLNLRYFEAWHYEDVMNGKSRQALSSWFLTLGHEIAHNVVALHNSEHEFWFAAICEAHMDKFSKLLESQSLSSSTSDS